MLDYPQRFGPSLADDIREWGERWVERAWERVGHLYPPSCAARPSEQLDMARATGRRPRPAGRPIAYLWTRTVRCPNPALASTRGPAGAPDVAGEEEGPLRRAASRSSTATRSAVAWEVVEAATPEGLGFDPAASRAAGTATCFVCGAAVDADYVKAEGKAGRMGITPLAAVLVEASGPRPRLPARPATYPQPDDRGLRGGAGRARRRATRRADHRRRHAGNFWSPLYGLTRFRDLFTPRQLATLCALAQGVREAHDEMLADGMEASGRRRSCAYLGLVLDRVADRSSNSVRWDISARED